MKHRKRTRHAASRTSLMPPLDIREQVESFLQALFGPFFGVGRNGYIEVRLIRSERNRHPIKQRFFPDIESVLDALPELHQANSDRERFNVYFGVNPRARKSGKEEDIEHVVALHTDVDWKRQQSDTLARTRFKFEPSINVFSGHGNHPYYLLKEPIHVVDESIRSMLRGYNAALATALGADRCYDLSRVLRLPGFKNWKDPQSPLMVQLQSCHPERRYALSDFDFLSPQPVPIAVQRALGAGHNKERPQLAERVRKLIESHPTLRLRWAGDPRGLNDTTKSGFDMSVASILTRAGSTDEETADALRLVPYNRDRQHQLTNQYLARTISKARADTKALSPAHPQEPIVRVSLTEAKARIAKWLAFSHGEDLAIDMALATKVANDTPGDPVFVVLVGPSSGAKSEIIRAFKDVPGVYSLGSLTARTFASGLDPKKASLLSRLPDDVHTLAFKDLGSILAMSPNERGDLLQQFRDIFDGMFRREWGSGKPALEWTGRLGLLAGATPAIEREFSTLAALGERFLFFRMRVADRELQAKRALEKCGHESEMRQEIHDVIASVLAGISPEQAASIEVPPESADIIQAIALALTQARTPVVRNRYDKTIEFFPVPEGPARAAKALKKLGQALAILHCHDFVGAPELAVLAQIGADSISSARARCLAWLCHQPSDQWHKSKSVGQGLQFPTTTTTRMLEDLAVLRIVDRVATNGAENAPFEVRLKPSFRSLLRKSGLATAMDRDYPPENADKGREGEDQLGLSADSEGWPQPSGAGRDSEARE